MADYFIDTLIEMMEHNRVDDQKELYERVFDANNQPRENAKEVVIEWMDDILDLSDVPRGGFRDAFMFDYIRNYHGCVDVILENIKEYCDEAARTDSPT